jgi:hypothetical protein
VEKLFPDGIEDDELEKCKARFTTWATPVKAGGNGGPADEKGMGGHGATATVADNYMKTICGLAEQAEEQWPVVVTSNPQISP